MQDTKVPAKSRALRTPADKRWYAVFLAHLATTSNVAASARAADVSPTKVYDARRRDPDFYRAWQEALCEGYEHLEMALVQRLRDGEIKPASGAKRGTRVFDNATALRLLVAHRDSVVRQQALRDVEDTGAILERINVRIDRLRAARVPAAEAQENADG
ncbi:hypothetical protein HNO88_003396 [Novosphingobium chloroacetimidivorans]|uniref:Terminase small subunit n=1 Tax=Novosphingobium chloroacetimidivorans TaxID=1428314 RepID=A0A7W7KDF5_9SPHN|nr:hypothetical protein [Novosphingobium chloroacetimidivorans]MBB4860058.1 hypothetical protein [Novosphingobium chloroacetimidivorans]